MRLSQLKGKESVITRRFAFPPNAKPSERFTVNVHYLSPALFDEQREKVKVKIVDGGGKRKGSEEISESEFKKLLIADILVRTIEKIEGCTIAKLRRLVNMSADAVAAAGGLDAVVPMDPTDPATKDEAIDNISFLLAECPEFFNWLVNVCTDLGNHQDEEWEEQVGNLRAGQATNSATA
jgi:hypothetical protein